MAVLLEEKRTGRVLKIVNRKHFALPHRSAMENGHSVTPLFGGNLEISKR
jgi:hypothetical protein